MEERLDPAEYEYREGYPLVELNPPGPGPAEVTAWVLLEASGEEILGLVERMVAGLRAMGSRRSLNVDRGSISSLDPTAYEGGEEGGENRIRWTGEDIFEWQDM